MFFHTKLKTDIQKSEESLVEYKKWLNGVQNDYKKTEIARSTSDDTKEKYYGKRYKKRLRKGQNTLIKTLSKLELNQLYDRVELCEAFYIKKLNVSDNGSGFDYLRHFVDPNNKEQPTWSDTPNSLKKNSVYRPALNLFIPRHDFDKKPAQRNSILSKKGSFTYVKKNCWSTFYAAYNFEVYLIVDPTLSFLKNNFIFKRNSNTCMKWHLNANFIKDNFIQFVLRHYYASNLTSLEEIEKDQKIAGKENRLPEMNEVLPSISVAAILGIATVNKPSHLEKGIFTNYFLRSLLNQSYPQFDQLWMNFPTYILYPTPEQDNSGLTKYTDDMLIEYLKSSECSDSFKNQMQNLYANYPDIFNEKISAFLKQHKILSEDFSDEITPEKTMDKSRGLKR